MPIKLYPILSCIALYVWIKAGIMKINNVSNDRHCPFCWQRSLKSNIRRTWVSNAIVDHSDVVGTSPVGAAPTTSSFSTEHSSSIYCVKTPASRVKKHLSYRICCVLYQTFYGICTFRTDTAPYATWCSSSYTCNRTFCWWTEPVSWTNGW